MIMSKQVRVTFSRLSPLNRPTASLEFRRHKDATDPGYIIGFLSQWKVYLDQIPMGPEAERFRGKKLDPTVFEKVRCELHYTSWPANRSWLAILSAFGRTVGSDVRAYAGYEGCLEASQRVDSVGGHST